MADAITKTETGQATDGGTVEQSVVQATDQPEHGVPTEPLGKDLTPKTVDQAAADAVLAELELDGPVTPPQGDPGQNQPQQTDREKELADRLSEQGRELKELRTLIAQGNNPQDPASMRRSEPTGDPTQDNINLLGDAYVELDNKINNYLQSQESINSYLGEGIDRTTAQRLVELEQSSSVEDRITWRREYNQAIAQQEQARAQHIDNQRVRDFQATNDGNGYGGTAARSQSHGSLSPAVVAKKLREKYPTSDARMDALEALEGAQGADFADEVLAHLNR